MEGYNTPGHIRKRTDSRLGAGIADFSNLDKSGNIMSDQDRVWFFKLGDRLWHSDSSFRPVPAKYSLLSGRVLPSWGANTEFADMRAAYDALDDRTKREIDDLVCEHSLLFSREAIGFTDMTPEERVAFRPVRQRLVRMHPVTGRKSLFLSSHAGTILGWTVPEARMFLRDLTEFATQDRFVYSHEWRVERFGDLGQSHHDASCSPVRSGRGPRCAAHHARGRRGDDGAGRAGGLTAAAHRHDLAAPSWPGLTRPSMAARNRERVPRKMAGSSPAMTVGVGP